MVLMVLTIQPGSFRSRVEFQVDNAQLVRSTAVKVSVMALPYKAVNPPLRKADRLSLAIGDMLFG